MTDQKFYHIYQNPVIYQELCEQLRSGYAFCSLDDQEFMRNIFQSITQRNDRVALEGLLNAGLPLDYTMPQYIMKNVGAFAFVNLALDCLKLLEEKGFDFTRNVFMVDKKNFFLYAITRSELPFVEFITKHLNKKGSNGATKAFNEIDSYSKNALHLAVEQHNEAVFDYVLSLPIDYTTYTQKNDNDESPFILSICLSEEAYTQKIIEKFNTIEWYDYLLQDLKFIQSDTYAMHEEYTKWSGVIQANKEKLLLENSIGYTNTNRALNDNDNNNSNNNHENGKNHNKNDEHVIVGHETNSASYKKIIKI